MASVGGMMVKSSSGVLLSRGQHLYRKTDAAMGTFQTTSRPPGPAKGSPMNGRLRVTHGKGDVEVDDDDNATDAVVSRGAVVTWAAADSAGMAVFRSALVVLHALFWQLVAGEVVQLLRQLLAPAWWPWPLASKPLASSRAAVAAVASTGDTDFDLDSDEDKPLIREAMALERALVPKQAAKAYERAAAACPRSAEARIRWSKVSTRPIR